MFIFINKDKSSTEVSYLSENSDEGGKLVSMYRSTVTPPPGWLVPHPHEVRIHPVRDEEDVYMVLVTH